MYVKRKIEDKFASYLKEPEILALVGPRQCGKTTLLQNLSRAFGDRAVYLTFEDQKLLDLFENHIDNFIELYHGKFDCIFIDEFQYAKNGGKLLKYWYDTRWDKIVVSGSSVIDLTVKAVKFLVGRILVFNLYPFDFEEYLSAKNPDLASVYRNHRRQLDSLAPSEAPAANWHEQFLPFMEDFIIYGGYPRVVLAGNAELKTELLKNIYNNFFLKEVRDILGLIDDFRLAKLVQALALQIGNLIEYKELSQVSEMSFPTVKKYCNFLSKTFVCRFLKPFKTNRRSQLVKSPKVYFSDTGLRNYIVNDFRPVDSRLDGGALLENAAAAQIAKQNLELYYWRTKKGSEVDFVVDLPERRKLALEIKKMLNPQDIRAKNVLEFSKTYPDIPLVFIYLKSKASARTAWPIYFL